MSPTLPPGDDRFVPSGDHRCARPDAGPEMPVLIGVAALIDQAIAIDNARLYARLADAVLTSRMSYRL